MRSSCPRRGKALRAAEEQRHSEAPHRHVEEAVSAALKSQNDSETHQCTEPIESLSVNHQNDGEESSEVRSSVAAARFTLEQRREAVRVAVQTQKADAELSLRVANAEARTSAWEQKVSERESTPAAAEAAEEDTSKCSSWSIREQLRTRFSPSGNRGGRSVLDRTAIAAQQDTGPSQAIHGIQMELSV